MSDKPDDTSLTRSTYPTLRANIMTGSPAVLTEEMLIKGFKALKAHEEARRRKRIEMAPWNAEMVRVIFWLAENGRESDALRLSYIVASINQYGAMNTSGLNFIDGCVAEYKASLV